MTSRKAPLGFPYTPGVKTVVYRCVRTIEDHHTGTWQDVVVEDLASSTAPDPEITQTQMELHRYVRSVARDSFSESYLNYMLEQIARTHAGRRSLTYLEWESSFWRERKGLRFPITMLASRILSQLPTFTSFAPGTAPATGFEVMWENETHVWGLLDHKATWRENLRSLLTEPTE